MHIYFFLNNILITGHVTGILAEIVMTSEEGHVIGKEAGNILYNILQLQDLLNR